MPCFEWLGWFGRASYIPLLSWVIWSLVVSPWTFRLLRSVWFILSRISTYHIDLAWFSWPSESSCLHWQSLTWDIRWHVAMPAVWWPNMLHSGLEAKTCWFEKMFVLKMGWFSWFHVFRIPYHIRYARLLGVTFSWALYHYLVNRICCPPKDLIKLQDSCDVHPRRVWIQRHRHDPKSWFFNDILPKYQRS